MRSILDIRVQKLFLITIILKIGTSYLGWLLQDPWILGLTVPLGIMAAYITLGLKRHDRDLTDEKFADSCYYLGFIFTITSIIFCLFDLPNIGTKIEDIAVRFGAAMVSTVFGLVVRVYLVNFKKDFTDALKDTEDSVVEASQRFYEQLVIALEKISDFNSEVDNASRKTVEAVNIQVEALSKNYADKLTTFFNDLTTKNQEAFTKALAEVNSASLRLSNSVDEYAKSVSANLASIENKVTAFTEAVTNRLKTTTFPDEYFAKHLQGPLTQLTNSAKSLSNSVNVASTEIGESSVVLSDALKKLRTKAKATEGALEKVLNLTAQQQAVLDTAQGQLAALEQLTSNLSTFDEALARTLASINSSNSTMVELTTSVASMVAEGAKSREAFEAHLKAIIEKLPNATSSLAQPSPILRTVHDDIESNGNSRDSLPSIQPVNGA